MGAAPVLGKSQSHNMFLASANLTNLTTPARSRKESFSARKLNESHEVEVKNADLPELDLIAGTSVIKIINIFL